MLSYRQLCVALLAIAGAAGCPRQVGDVTPSSSNSGLENEPPGAAPGAESADTSTDPGTTDGWPPRISPDFDVLVPMPDGTRLMTDIHVPRGDGPWPVVLYRTLYDPNSFEWAFQHAQRASAFKDLGVAYVVQAGRGVGGSDGPLELFTHDQQDGQDMVTLLAAQSWCNGRIGLMGTSVAGISTYLTLPDVAELDTPPACAWIGNATPDLYHTIYPGGAFRLQLVLGWLGGPELSDVLADVLANATDEEWWRPWRLAGRYERVTTPTVHLTGWFDIFTQDQIDGFVAAQQAGAPAQHLIIGPWTHFGIDEQVQGQLTFPPNADLDGWTLLQQWVGHFLLGNDEIQDWPAVRYYTMGATDDPVAPGNEWRAAPAWPPPGVSTHTLYLQDQGMLVGAAPADEDGADQYTYDPLDPAPTWGGNNLMLEQGPYDQRAVEARDDVLTYTTAPLSQPLEVTGQVRARVFLACSTPDTDLIVRLTDVYPDGRSMLVTEGILRARFRNPTTPAGSLLTPGEVHEIAIDLWSTSIVFNTGHRLRIAITSSSYPRYDPNPNTGGPLGAQALPRPATITIQRSRRYPSAVNLPAAPATGGGR